ncbi:MAG TPA: MazG nucleotide pyrophosphohydrolase domain-containing protein, partial [Candidatus Staskawiczbacteria bacterium]|nr:MazG nucleotide pyrophosphohydrolase domain-containing protein [Candidatus Staskawiczbacteria bacterium]
YQLGVGGHINPIDGATGKDFLEEGMMREWNEEVDFKGNIVSKKLVGILNDDSRPVEKVHLGLVYSFEGDGPEISIKETDKMAGELVDLKDIGSKLKTNDGVWVKIVYREYLSKLIYAQSEFFTKYQEFVKSVTKKYEDPEKEIMTWGLGISGEAGDVAGCIKKTYSHNNDQMHGIRENLGDTLWYIAAICNFYGWNLEDIFNENVGKLKNRYSTGHFTKQDAAKRERIDWNEKK